MLKQDATAYEFGPFRLERGERRLLRDGRPVPLTARLFDILLLLVRNSGDVVTKETFMAEVWAGSFVEENNLTVCISSLRKTLGERHKEHEYIETVTKRGYRFVARVSQVEDENGARLHAARNVAGREARRAGGGEASASGLAVLPFLNVSESSDLEYLSDGITESIISSASRLPRLRVMARSTVFRYKGRELDVRQAGRELNVQTVLTGRLREFNGRLLLGVEMVDVSDGSQIWGETYNRPLSDILKVQEEIAGEISGKLRIGLTSEERGRLVPHHARRPEAYYLYLKGRYFLNKRTPKDIERAAEYFAESLRREPDYPLGRVGLADCYLARIFANVLPFREGIPAIRREAEAALALDETIAEAHASLAYVEMVSLNWQEAEREFRRAIELDPNNALARSRYSTYLTVRGRMEEARAHIERALTNDPLSPHMRVTAARVFYYDHQCERAMEQCRQALEIDPRCGEAHGIASMIYERRGMYDEAIAEVRRALDLLGGDPEALGLLGYFYAVSGRRRRAKRVLGEVLSLSEQKHIPPFAVACIYAGLREADAAFEWLERAFAERSYVPVFAVLPMFDGLRSDSRFDSLLSRSGLPRERPPAI